MFSQREEKGGVKMSSSAKIIRVFSARACAAPVEKAAQLFYTRTGIEVKIDVCSRHCARPEAEEATGTTGGDDFLLEIADAGIHDLAIAGAKYLLDDGEVKGIVKRGQTRIIAFRRSAIIVPVGNPANIHSLSDMAKDGMRIAISVIDCLKGMREDLSARTGLLASISRNITFRANGCVALVEAVAEHKVDAGFGWDAFKHLSPDRIEIVKLSPEQEIWRATCVGLLSFSKHQDEAVNFMNFLTAKAALSCYEEYGWTVLWD